MILKPKLAAFQLDSQAGFTKSKRGGFACVLVLAALWRTQISADYR
jgi:hypothetical protein